MFSHPGFVGNIHTGISRVQWKILELQDDKKQTTFLGWNYYLSQLRVQICLYIFKDTCTSSDWNMPALAIYAKVSY
jgi:hypothetical protein